MKIAIFICALFCAFVSNAQVVDLKDGRTGRIHFASTTPEHPWAMVYGTPGLSPAVTIFGDLLMPKNIPAGTKVPAVVVSHGSDGVTSLYYDLWAKELNNAGIAVFIVYTYKPRGFDAHTADTRLYQNATANLSDALHALKLLATHPQIDANKIFSVGGSTGGRVAMYGAFPAYLRVVVPAPLKWAGSVALYPSGCATRYRVEHMGTNPAPLLMLLAGKDDSTPAKPCIEYADKLKGGGHNVEYKVYPNAYHAFDRLTKNYASYSDSLGGKVIDVAGGDCDMEVTLNPNSPGIGLNGYDFVQKKELKTGKDWGEALKACQRTNVPIRIGSDPEARADAVKTVIEFITSPKPK